MTTFLRMCALVLAVQASASQVANVAKLAGEKNINLLMNAMGNTTAMLEEIEKAASSGHTPFSPDLVRDITKLIDDSIRAPLTASWNLRKVGMTGSVNSVYEEFKKCNAEPVDGASKVLYESIDALRLDHENCRDTLTDHHENAAQACVNLDDFLGNVATWGDTNPLPAADDKTARVAWVNKATAAEICNKDDAETKLDNCDGALAEVKEYELEAERKDWKCNAKQIIFEEKICDWRSEVKVECDAAYKCYHVTAEDALKAHKEESEELTKGWQAESLALKKITCYLTAFDTTHNDTMNAAKLESCKTTTDDSDWTIPYDDSRKTAYKKCADRIYVGNDVFAKANTRYPGTAGFREDEYLKPDGSRLARLHGLEETTACAGEDGPTANTLAQTAATPKLLEATTSKLEANTSKRLVRREPKKPKPSSLAELDSQGRVLDMKVEAAAETPTQKSNLRDMDVDSLMNLVISSGASTKEIKAAMTKAVLKLQGSSV